MKIKNWRSFWSGMMFVVVGVGFAWGATAYDFGTAARPGPAYFPFGLGLVLALLGVLVLLSSFAQAQNVEIECVGAIAWRPLSIILGAIVLFGFLLPRLGMVVTLPLLVFIASVAGDEFHWIEALVNALFLTAGSWLVFIVGLGLTIPLWPTFIALGV